MDIPLAYHITFGTYGTRLHGNERGSVDRAHNAPGEPFHFGRRLAELIARYDMERCFYIGGGAAPLLPASEMTDVARAMLAASQLLVTNNFYSSDFVAFGPTSVLEGHPLPDSDNELAWLLGEEAGLPIRELPRSGATQFDVATPMDLLTLAVHPGAGPHTPDRSRRAA